MAAAGADAAAEEEVEVDAAELSIARSRSGCSARVKLHPAMAAYHSPLCSVIPYRTPHSVSVSLPKWQDNVDYEEGKPRVAAKMTSGYPRFFVHHSIQQVYLTGFSLFRV